MNNIIRRVLAALIGTALLCLSGCGDVQQPSEDGTYEMTMLCSFAETSQQGTLALKIAECIGAETEEKIHVTVYPNAQITSVDKELTLVRTNTMTSAYSAAGPTEAVIPAFSFATIPFLFANRQVGDFSLVKSLYEDTAFISLMDELAREQGYKMYWNIPAMSGNMLSANNVRAFEHPQDGAGLKIRTPGGVFYDMYIKATGSSPTSIAATEMAVALSQGICDGFLTSIVHTALSQWRIKYLTVPVYAINPTPFMVNLEWYDSLPEELQEQMDAGVAKALEYAYETTAQLDIDSIEYMKNEWGTQVIEWNFSDPENKAWADSLMQEGIDAYVEANGEIGQKIVDIILQKRIELGFN